MECQFDAVVLFLPLFYILNYLIYSVIQALLDFILGVSDKNKCVFKNFICMKCAYATVDIYINVYYFVAQISKYCTCMFQWHSLKA